MVNLRLFYLSTNIKLHFAYNFIIFAFDCHTIFANNIDLYMLKQVKLYQRTLKWKQTLRNTVDSNIYA